jgi:hypothetical protein
MLVEDLIAGHAGSRDVPLTVTAEKRACHGLRCVGLISCREIQTVIISIHRHFMPSAEN